MEPAVEEEPEQDLETVVTMAEPSTGMGDDEIMQERCVHVRTGCTCMYMCTLHMYIDSHHYNIPIELHNHMAMFTHVMGVIRCVGVNSCVGVIGY